MKIYIYSNDTDELVEVIEGVDNADCERKANEAWGINDYTWSYTQEE